MKGKWVFWLKVIVLLAVAAFMTREIHRVLTGVAAKNVAIQWKWGAIAVAGFCASMLASAIVWRMLARRMNGLGSDGLATIPLLGAYTFSQIGKYIPGKVGLLLMRIDRAKKLGMSTGVSTLSTILENALYLVSGGLISMTAVMQILAELHVQGHIGGWQQKLQWPLIILVVAVLCTVCHPKVFYSLVNRLLRGMKKPEVAPEQRLEMKTLVAAVAGFVPCWIFGGIALWASTRCVADVGIAECAWFAGAFALSVILGMVSLLPGGLLVREAVLGAAVAIELAPALGHDKAVALGLVAAGLQRLFQLAAELLMALIGFVAAKFGRPENTDGSDTGVNSNLSAQKTKR